MKGAIVSIQLPGDARKNNERYLRAVCDSSAVEDLRKLVTAMMKHPADYAIGNKTAKPNWRSQKVKQPDDDLIPGVEVNAKVDEAMAAV